MTLEDLAIRSFGWLFSRSMNKGAEIFDENLKEKLLKEVHDWGKGLPKQWGMTATLFPDAEDSLSRSQDLPWLEKLRETFSNDKIPSHALWTHALLERRRLLAEKHDAPLYSISDEEIRPRLEELAKRLVKVCREDPVMSQKAVIQTVEEIREQENQGQHTPPRINWDEANRLFLELPVDTVPKKADLPIGSFLPFSPNPNFTGRKTELHQLAHLLKENTMGAIGQLGNVTGMGGIGKTQLAIAFAFRYGKYFQGGVFWVSLAEPGAVPAEIARCGMRGCLDQPANFEDLPLASQVARVQQAWQQPVPRLLIFDNCEDEELLTRWRPKSGGCRVVVTSRKESWEDPSIKTLPLATLERAESITLLQRYKKPLDHDDADRIAAALGDLALALHMAGSFLKRYPIAPAEYLEQLSDANPLDHASLKGRKMKFSPTKHDLDVGKTFAVSLDKLDPSDATDVLARDLLARAAIFAAGEPIPASLLAATLPQLPERLDLEDAFQRLAELGLVTRNGTEDPLIHRLVARYAERVLVESEVLEQVETVVCSEADKLNHAGFPGPLLAWQVHLRAITDRALQRQDERAGNLASALDFHLGSLGSYRDAKVYSEHALNIRKKVLGDQHPNTASSLWWMGILAQKDGEKETARDYYEQAAMIYEKQLGKDHPDTKNVRGHLEDLGPKEPGFSPRISTDQRGSGTGSGQDPL